MKNIIFILTLILLGSCSSPSFSDSNNYEEGKEAADFFMNDWQEHYDDLCAGPRNGNQKKEFADLGKTMRAIYEGPYLANKLDFEIQKKLIDYVSEKMKNDYPDLEELALHEMINCW